MGSLAYMLECATNSKLSNTEHTKVSIQLSLENVEQQDGFIDVATLLTVLTVGLNSQLFKGNELVLCTSHSQLLFFQVYWTL